jgi:peptide/nickel transport system substrate-binding protein
MRHFDKLTRCLALRRVLAAPLALGLALGVAALLAVEPVGAAEGPLIVNTSRAPPTLDPVNVCDITDHGFIASLYVALLAYEDKPIDGAPSGIAATQEDTTKFKGDLAKSWNVSADGTKLTFNLTPGVKFPSGRPVDAAAVAASLTRAWKSGKCGTYFFEAAQYGNTQSIEAVDDLTVVITLAKAEPLVLHALTQPNLAIVDVKLVEEMGGDEWLASHVAGFGPYLLEDYQPGVRAKFVRNPTYFGKPALEAEVIVNFIADNATLLLQARNRNAHVTLGLQKSSVASLADHEGLSVIAVESSRWQLIGLPNEVVPFDNVKFREALTYAVPYQQILDKVAFGYAQIYYGPFPPAFPSYNAELGAPRAFDLDKARALIKESGVILPVATDMVIREGEFAHDQIATIVQSTWRELGVNVTIQKLPASGYQEAIYTETKQSTLIRIDGPSVTDPGWLFDYDLRCASFFNTSDYCNPAAEALLDEAHPLLDESKRQVYWDKIAKMWVADSPRIPVYADIYTAIVSDDVKVWHYQQDGPFDLHRWSR